METGADTRYPTLVQSIRDYGIVMLDAEGCVLTWNPGAERINGYRADQIVGRHFSLLYAQADRQAGLPDHILQTAASQGGFRGEVLFVRRDGRELCAQLAVDPIEHCHGGLLGFSLVSHDVTERKQTQQALRDADRRFRLFVDRVEHYAICMLDNRGVVTDWNAGAQRINGYPAEEIVGRPLAQLFDDPGTAERLLAEARRTGRCELEQWERRKDGSRFLAEILIKAIRDREGELVGFAQITRDVTEREQAEKRLEETRAQLFQSQKVEALGQLTGGIAHDFNNLLQGITGALDVISMRLAKRPDASDTRRFIDLALDSSHRAAQMINRLLAFARQQPLEPAYVNINQLVADMAELLMPTLGRQVELKMDLAPGLGSALCDANQFESALLNLAINARDAMPDGGVLTIRTGQAAHPGAPLTPRNPALPPAPYLGLQVADTGIGMSPEVSARAFEPFYTTKPKGHGTGLGLAMIHGFVTQAQGMVELDSQPGRGTVITLYLPCRDRRTRQREDHARADPPSHGRAPTILLVQDEPATRKLVAEKLRERSYHVLEAVDGRAGLVILESSIPLDLVIAELDLPGLDGAQMFGAAHPLRPELRAVFLAGDEADRPPGHEHADVLPKPINADTLVRHVERLLPMGSAG